METHWNITEYDDSAHRARVMDLWQRVFHYESAHNRPERVIDEKRAVDDGFFFVALAEGGVVGTVMAGYDGHRGWIYSLAVLPEERGRGIGSGLLAHAERALARRGCHKVNLQILADNEAVRAFYEAKGFLVEERISMGKVLS